MENTTTIDLNTGINFLEALKVQLENKDALAVENSRSQYGSLVPEVKTKNEREAFTVSSLRMGQARVISDAIMAIDLLREKKRKRRQRADKTTDESGATEATESTVASTETTEEEANVPKAEATTGAS